MKKRIVILLLALSALLCTAVLADGEKLPQGRAVAGKYTFELDTKGELWLLAGDGEAAHLPDVGEAARKQVVRCFFDTVKAEPVSGGVRVEALATSLTGEFVYGSYVTVYPYSSLEWVLAHQTQDWEQEEVCRTDNGAMVMRQVRVGPSGTELQWAWGSGNTTYGAWRAIPTPGWGQWWSGAVTLLPYNGKTFLVQDRFSLELYASWDGQSWTCLKDTFLGAEHPAGVSRENFVYRADHSLLWTGSEYMACRLSIETGHPGVMFAGSGQWYSPYTTKVVFADANWQVTGEYDFGRRVVGVSYANGVYYAEVSESKTVNFADFDHEAGTVIWKSTDKKNWEKTDLAQVFAALTRVA